jgi:hypothetical protein
VSKSSIKNRTLASYRMFHVFWHREEMCYFMICILHALHFSLCSPVSEPSSAVTLFQYVICYHRECFSDLELLVSQLAFILQVYHASQLAPQNEVQGTQVR